MRNKGYHFNAPEIVAKTGWTTFELAEHILHNQLNEKYDFVTLLIGVNNQYRNLLAEYYQTDFEFLLKKAIHFTGEHPEKVIVLSIPDWGATPFAKGRDLKKIMEEIDLFNRINKEITEKYKAVYIDITKTSRDAGNEDSLTEDKLHPSGKQYAIWAGYVAEEMEKLLHK
jgi:lysophospholipase L1-like esterase